MAKKKKSVCEDRHMKLAVLVIVAVGFIVLAYLMGVRNTLGALAGSLPF